MKKPAGQIVRVIILIVGIILLLWFLVPTLLTRSFHIGALTGIGISAVMVLYGIFGRWVNELICHLWKNVAGKLMLSALALIVTCILILALMCMIKIGNGKQYPPKEGSTCVVLGCRVYSYGPSLMLTARMDAAIEYLNENPDSVCIVCGGQGANEPAAEADVMYEYMTGKGIAPGRIYGSGRRGGIHAVVDVPCFICERNVRHNGAVGD